MATLRRPRGVAGDVVHERGLARRARRRRRVLRRSTCCAGRSPRGSGASRSRRSARAGCVAPLLLVRVPGARRDRAGRRAAAAAVRHAARAAARSLAGRRSPSGRGGLFYVAVVLRHRRTGGVVGALPRRRSGSAPRSRSTRSSVSSPSACRSLAAARRAAAAAAVGQRRRADRQPVPAALPRRLAPAPGGALWALALLLAILNAGLFVEARRPRLPALQVGSLLSWACSAPGGCEAAGSVGCCRRSP